MIPTCWILNDVFAAVVPADRVFVGGCVDDIPIGCCYRVATIPRGAVAAGYFRCGSGTYFIPSSRLDLKSGIRANNVKTIRCICRPARPLVRSLDEFKSTGQQILEINFLENIMSSGGAYQGKLTKIIALRKSARQPVMDEAQRLYQWRHRRYGTKAAPTAIICDRRCWRSGSCRASGTQAQSSNRGKHGAQLRTDRRYGCYKQSIS